MSRRVFELSKPVRALLDVVDDPIFVHDQDFRLLYANAAYLRLAKKDWLAIRGLPYWQVFPRGDQPLPACLQAIDENNVCSEIIHQEGCSYSSRSFPVCEQERYLYSFHLLKDLTARQRLLARLKRQRKTMRQVLDSLVDAVFIADEEGRFIEVNEKACASLGYRRATLCQLGVLDVDVKMDAAQIAKIWQRVVLDGESLVVQGEHQRKDGSQFPVEVHIGPVSMKGGVHLLAIVRDLSAHVQLEQSLRRRLAMEGIIRSATIKLSDVGVLDEVMPEIMLALGRFSKADRACFFSYDACSDSMTSRSHWGAVVDEVDQAIWQGARFSQHYAWFAEQLLAGASVVIPGLDALPAKAKPFKRALQSQSILSLLAVPIMVEGALYGYLQLETTQQVVRWDSDDFEVLKLVAQILAKALVEKRLRALAEVHQGELEHMFDHLVKAITQLVEQRDPYTAGHQSRVAALAVAIAEKMALSQAVVKGVAVGSLLHDVGKTRVPVEILSSSRPLTDLEYQMIQLHPEAGYQIVVEVPFVWPVKEMILQHHERMDGSGYPQGLSGDEIILEAKIIAVADVYEAMVSNRPYRPAREVSEARAELLKNAGKLYDPAVVDACMAVLDEGFSFPAQTLNP